ncbi:hypothetical protein [Sphaerisporangium rubeum]|uniref:hypothetical protein n=1 Tax=Sphaerisporangium rubeum TaxID=321317 RepID=UPI0031D72CB3
MATVIAATLGLAGAIAQNWINIGPEASVVSPTVTVTVTQTLAAEASPDPSRMVPLESSIPSVSPSSTSAPDPAVFWQGSVVVGYSRKDLDSSPPAMAGDNDGDLSIISGDIYASDDATIAFLLGRKIKPGYGECYELSMASGLEQVSDATPGWYCIRTSEGRVVALNIRSLAGGTFSGDVTIWDHTGVFN